MSTRFTFRWLTPPPNANLIIETFADDTCRYLVYGVSPHIPKHQETIGFFITKDMMTVPAVSKALRVGRSCSVVKQATGTTWENIDQGTMLKNFKEIGIRFPMKKTFKNSCKAIVDGISIDTVARQNPEVFVRSCDGLRDLARLTLPSYDHTCQRGHWYVGAPGTGKSAFARTEISIYQKAQNKWFDGYTGETVIVLDDLDSNSLGHLLKIWCDRYACNGETRKGTVCLRHKKFIVTSNYSIDGLFFATPEVCEALKRRFTVRNFDLFPYDPVPRESMWTPCTPDGAPNDAVSELTPIKTELN